MNKTVLTVIALFIVAITACLMYFYLSIRKVKDKKGKKLIELIKTSFNKKMMLLSIGTFIMSIIVFVYGYYFDELSCVQSFMNAEILIWITTLGYIDFKERIIPNKMILAGLTFWLLLILVDIFIAKTPVKSVLVYSLLGGLLCSGVLFLIALILKTALGMGDVKMFLVIGLLYGVSNTYTILLFSIFTMAIVSIVLLIMKKVTKKTAMPMAPFVVLGFLLNAFLAM